MDGGYHPGGHFLDNHVRKNLRIIAQTLSYLQVVVLNIIPVLSDLLGFCKGLPFFLQYRSRPKYG